MIDIKSEHIEHFEFIKDSGISKAVLDQIQAAGGQLSVDDLPNSKNEFWRYTSIEKKLSKIKQYRHTSISEEMADNLSQELREVYRPEYTTQFTFVNGIFSSFESDGQSIDLASPELINADKIDHTEVKTLDKLNRAFLADIISFKMKKTQVPIKIEIVHLFSGDKETEFWPNEIRIELEDGASAAIEEVFYFEKEAEGFASHRSHIEVNPKAHLDYTQILLGSEKATVVCNTSINIKEDAVVTGYVLARGGELTRSEIHVDLLGEQATCDLGGVYLARNKEVVDLRPRIRHLVGKNKSRQLFKGILSDDSRAIFNGQIYIAKQAQETDSNMINKSLILGDRAEVDTKPELEVYADNVKAGHGASIGRLNDDELFYMKSRGVSEEMAKKMLLESFVQECLNLRSYSKTQALRALQQGFVESFFRGQD